MSKRLIIAAAGVAALVATGSAYAITNGQHDGNMHPNVGAMMAFDDPSQPNTLQLLCSGTLVAPQVFLTAAHCTDFLLNDLHTTDVFVTFNTNSAEGPYIHGTMLQNPAYNGKPAQNGNDVAVILLDNAPQGITPAALPPVGLLYSMKANKTLTQSSAFTAVGYGDGNRQVGGGQPTFAFDGFRGNATSFFNALTDSWLRLTQNASVGAGDVASNRYASYRYELLERLECGIQLSGTEVKALRSSGAQLKEGYVAIRGGELQRLGGRRRFAEFVANALLTDDGLQPVAYDLMVVDQEHFAHGLASFGAARSGTRTMIVVPCPGTPMTSNVAPTRIARSPMPRTFPPASA